MARRTITRLAALGALGLAVLLVFAVGRGGGEQHLLRLEVADATNMIAGQEVRVGGRRIGEVSDMRATGRGRGVQLTLSIEDEHWPLPEGTRATFRWGGTIAYVNRYVAMAPGPAGNPPLAEGATLRGTDVGVPIELDSFLSTFTPETRRDLGRLVTNGGRAMREARPALRAALASAPPALTETSAVLQDLTADRAALDTLVRSTSSVVDAVRRADPGVGPLITGASKTFRTVADRTASLKSALDLSAETLAGTERTLRRARTTLRSAGDVTARIAPGVGELRRIASPLNGTLKSVVAVAPDAKGTLRTVRTAAPALTGLLDRATRELPTIGSLGTQTAKAVSCIRPYSPEVAGFFSVWSDFLSFSDGKDKFLRAQVQSFLPASSNISNQNSAQAKAAFPGMEYGYPRPPGTNAGQPWLLPECNAGKDALDPAKDPESRVPSNYAQLPEMTRKPVGSGG